MEANKILLQMKYTRIVDQFAKQVNIPIEQALDFFYHSITYQDLRDGIADLHCRRDHSPFAMADERLQQPHCLWHRSQIASGRL